jgi:hypothetical protein
LKKLLVRVVRQSPAMIVAMLALFVALTGTAVATTSALIGSAQIRNNSITGLDVKNRSLRPIDFRGSVRGPRGLRGLTGATGATGAAGAKGDKGDKGDAGVSAFADVGVVANETAFTTSSTTFVDVPGVSTTVTVPAGKTATVIAWFSAESTCLGGDPGDWCQARLLLDDVEMLPAEGKASVFDSHDDGNLANAYEHNAMVRHAVNVGSGTHTIKAQAAVDEVGATATTMRIDDLSLVAQAIE